MRNAILAITAALLPLASACATDPGETDTDITLESFDASGKADAVNGTQLRLRGDFWYANSDAETTGANAAKMSDLSTAKTARVDVKTGQTTVVSSAWFMFRGALHGNQRNTHFTYDQILRVAPRGPAGVRMGMVMGTPFDKVTCQHGAARSNVFTSVAVNLQSKEIYANDTTTFSFAECGIEVDDPDVMQFAFFPLPLSSASSLAGKSFTYYLDEELL